ncbi:MAG: hypothetical protein HDT15_01210 [Oscillibacter sp.]|nr:hypothetical protein [Oscillibacter sp.]
MKVKAYIHSLKDHVHDRHVLGDAEIIRQIGDNLYLTEVNGVRCTAIFNIFTGAYYVDDVYGIQREAAHVQETQGSGGK